MMKKNLNLAAFVIMRLKKSLDWFVNKKIERLGSWVDINDQQIFISAFTPQVPLCLFLSFQLC